MKKIIENHEFKQRIVSEEEASGTMVQPKEIKEKIEEKKCEHHWAISSFEQYPEIDGSRYCYVICLNCGQVQREKINCKI